MPLQLPFFIAVDDFGHLVMDFTAKPPPVFGVGRWLPRPMRPTLPEIEDFRAENMMAHESVYVQASPSIQSGSDPDLINLNRQLFPHAVTAVRKRVDLWYSRYSLTGAEIFHDNTNLRLAGASQIRRERELEPDTRFQWCVAGAPMPGTEVNAERWYTWGFILHVDLFPTPER